MSEPRVLQMRCAECKQSRYFVYVDNGEVEITCAGCGVRSRRVADEANRLRPKETT